MADDASRSVVKMVSDMPKTWSLLIEVPPVPPVVGSGMGVTGRGCATMVLSVGMTPYWRAFLMFLLDIGVDFSSGGKLGAK